MAAAPDPSRPANPARRRVLLLGCDRSSSWLAAVASRPDLELTTEPGAEMLALVVIDRTGAAPPEPAAIGELHRSHPGLPLLVLLPAGENALSREAVFAAGASDVLYLPPDAERIEETLTQLADLPSRRHPRFRVRLPLLAGEPGAEQEGVVENLSEGGAQVRLPSASVGEVLRMKITLGEGMAPVELWGLVRVTAPLEKGSLARVRFVGLRPAERALLEHFLEGLDAVSRATEPVEALPAIGRLDRPSLSVALTSGEAGTAEWLTRALGELSPRERSALEGGSGPGWAEAALVHVRSMAIADVLERFDPLLDEPPSISGREAVLRAIEEVETFRAAFDARLPRSASAEEEERQALRKALGETASRLLRAISARLPDLATAYEFAGGRSGALRMLELPGQGADRARRLRNRLLAVAAGLTLGGALIYTVAVLLSR